MVYLRQLAFIHDVAFTQFSRRIAPEVLGILREAGIGTGIIVEVGCGSGVLAARLAGAGYKVHGLDVSPAMIALARRRAPRASFRVADLNTASLEKCAAVVCVGEVVTYAPGGLPALRKFFRRVYDALPAGGLFLFDFIHSAARRTYATKAIGGRDWSMAVRADYNRRTRTLTRQIATVRRGRSRSIACGETHHVRVYQRNEIIATLRRIGFRVKSSRSIGKYRLLPGDTAILARRTEE